MTVTVRPLGADRLTVKTALVVPVSPSVTATSLMERLGRGSLLLMVPTPWASVRRALLGLDRLIKNVSSSSLKMSPMTCTVMG